MPVPSGFGDLNTDPTLNSPSGAEPIGNNADNYFRAAFSFIKQLYQGTIVPITALNFNAQRVTNIAQGTANSDAITLAQLKGIPKVGEVKMYHGAVSAIASTFGAGWQLADGTNGTADLRDRFIVGAGLNYTPAVTGGNSFITLTVAQMPAHAHSVYDPGHAHAVADGGHNHGINVYDPGHAHGLQNLGSAQAGSDNGGCATSCSTGFGTSRVQSGTYASGTGISVSANAATTGIGIYGSGTGIATYNNGGGGSFDNRPPYFALCFIEYTGIGVSLS